MRYCLIGERLGHSFSKLIHESQGLGYDLVELSPCALEGFVKSGGYDGFNVTIPYKKAIMPFLDEIEEGARLVGAVNTVKREGARLIGYNTDLKGLDYLISRKGVSLEGKNVIVLGSGGASATAVALARLRGAGKVDVVSRSGEINYDNCYARCKDASVIINATPVGMYPNLNVAPVCLSRFECLEAVFDCVYNPVRTRLVLEAEALGLKTAGGLAMLVEQAVESEKIWGQNAENTGNILRSLAIEKNNIVLSGMAGCGKTTLGRMLKKELKRELFDVDDEVAKKTGRTPSEIILTEGEELFRDVESEVISELSRSGGKIISLGGGSVLRPENVAKLKQNGIIIYVERDLSLLTSKGRPLSQREGVEALFNKREKIYQSTADCKVKNNGEPEAAVREIIKIYEDSCYKRS